MKPALQPLHASHLVELDRDLDDFEQTMPIQQTMASRHHRIDGGGIDPVMGDRGVADHLLGLPPGQPAQIAHQRGELTGSDVDGDALIGLQSPQRLLGQREQFLLVGQ